ncbi:MAG: type II CRISPR-associated endonuclease Cas1 [Ruminococcus flavefaciens]|jgi:CRISPR-associated endonuclease Cas1 subtype II|nr:type II CRISPR-associated endonuclease Cas1 [Ruminococcus flavefaciens]
MSWRTVVISKRAKLDMKTGYLVVRSEESTSKINLDEISVLIIENTAVSITGCLIAALTEKKIKVIFCNEKRDPTCELVSYYGSHDTSAKLRKQIRWSEDVKSYIWSEIIAEKIRKQSEFLEELEKSNEAEMLRNYIEELEIGDVTNREGHAAKVYFNALFGKEFTRSQECVTNAALNYGYSIILSYFNREITAHGYVTQLGLFHSNMFNHFNLSCDLMEPFRVIVDRCVVKNSFTKFDKEEKHILVDILNSTVYMNGMEQYLGNAIKLYCRSVFDALNDNDVSQITFYSLKRRE